jgi:hypothetical protein
MAENEQNDTVTVNKGGRPSDYRAVYARQATKLTEMGATDAELADFFGVAVSTIYLWKLKHPKFSEAIRLGKEPADVRVERSLYQSAIDGNPTSMIFWLKNRRSDRWRDWKEHEHKGTVSLEMLVADDDETDGDE